MILSHDHYDHLDYPTIRELAKLDVPFVTSLGVGAHLEAWGVPTGTHRRARLVGVVCAARTVNYPSRPGPSQHFSGRGLHDRNATLWSSMIVRSATARGVLQRRHRPDDASTRRSASASARSISSCWRWAPIIRRGATFTLGPSTRSKRCALLGGGPFLPVHWGTFSAGDARLGSAGGSAADARSEQGAQLLMPRLGEPIEPATWASDSRHGGGERRYDRPVNDPCTRRPYPVPKSAPAAALD